MLSKVLVLLVLLLVLLLPLPTYPRAANWGATGRLLQLECQLSYLWKSRLKIKDQAQPQLSARQDTVETTNSGGRNWRT